MIGRRCIRNEFVAGKSGLFTVDSDRQVEGVRFVLVTETFPPEINGVAMSLERILRKMAESGHAVRVIRPRQPGDGGREMEFADVLVPGIPLWGYDGLRMGLPWYLRVRRAIRDFQADAVYVATEGPLGIAAILASRRLRVKVVTGYHTNFPQYFRHYRLGFLAGTMDRFMRWLHNSTAATFAPSEDVTADLERRRYRNVRLLGRGVDIDLFDPARRDAGLRAEWGADEATIVFFYVGRVAGEKNLDLFFRGAEHLAGTGVAMKVVVVGDGPELPRLRKAHPSAVFCGAKRGEDLARHVASGDLFFFPSQTETFGNVITEAMASGLAVVSYNYAAGARFIRDGENGWLAVLGDGDALIEALDRALAARARWPEIRKAAREATFGVSWGSIVRRFVEDLDQLDSRSGA